MNKPHTLYLLTSGQAFVLNEAGEQIKELQQHFMQGGDIDRERLREIALQCERFALYRFGPEHKIIPLDKDEFFRLFHLRP